MKPHKTISIIAYTLLGTSLALSLLWLTKLKVDRSDDDPETPAPDQSNQNPDGPNLKSENNQSQPSAIIEPNWLNPWRIEYAEEVKKWVAPKTIRGLTQSTATGLAKKLFEAKGGGWFLNDDESAVEEVFASLQDKVQVSVLSRTFFELYNRDLYDHLRSFLSSYELSHLVTTPIAALADYRIKPPDQ